MVDPGRSPLGRITRYLILAGIILVMLPIVLLSLYRLPFIHPVSTLMVKDLVTFSGYDRRWVSMDQISPTLVSSVMMSEDAKFCFHSGVDWDALNSVVSDAIDGEQTRGASTITMQTAKNLFLWTSRSFIRKGLEVPLAVITDLILPKQSPDGDLSEHCGMGPRYLRHRSGRSTPFQCQCCQAYHRVKLPILP